MTCFMLFAKDSNPYHASSTYCYYADYSLSLSG